VETEIICHDQTLLDMKERENW